MSVSIELSTLAAKGPDGDHQRSHEVRKTPLRASSCDGTVSAKKGNEYEDVESKAVLGQEPRCGRQAENPLYGGRGDTELVHPLVGRGKMKNKCPSALVGLAFAAKNELLTLRGASFVVLLIALSMAIGSMVLVSLLFERVPNSCGVYNKLMDELNIAADQLLCLLDTLTSQVIQNQNAISARISSLTAYGSTLDFSRCQTAQFECVTISPTTPSCVVAYPPQSPNDTIVSTYCAVTKSVEERNPMIAILLRDPDTGYFCRCQIITLITDWPPNTTFGCTMFVTTCPMINNISFNLV